MEQQTRWEYALVYLRQGEGVERRRWILFSHQQDGALRNRLPVLPDLCSPSNLELDPARASTTAIMGALGEAGWELTSSEWLPPLNAGCLYFKRPLLHSRPLANPTSTKEGK